jgi:hypothetical protein
MGSSNRGPFGKLFFQYFSAPPRLFGQEGKDQRCHMASYLRLVCAF